MTIQERGLITLPLSVDTNDWTLGEIEVIEDVMNKPIGALQGLTPQQMSVKQIIALSFISAKRIDPDVTLEEIRLLTDGDLDFGGNDEADLGPLEDQTSSEDATE